MSENKVIVLGIPFSFDDNALYDYFQDCGEISEASVVKDRVTKKSRGFGFITFSSEDGVMNALKKNGTESEGRTIRVEKAQERPRREQRENRERPPRDASRPHREFNDANKIMVTSLSWNITDDALHEAFSKYGELEECLVLKDHYSGKSRGRGIIRFATEEAMNQAISEMNGAELDGRAIVVRQFVPRSQMGDRQPEMKRQAKQVEEEEKEELEEEKEEPEQPEEESEEKVEEESEEKVEEEPEEPEEPEEKVEEEPEEPEEKVEEEPEEPEEPKEEPEKTEEKVEEEEMKESEESGKPEKKEKKSKKTKKEKKEKKAKKAKKSSK